LVTVSITIFAYVFPRQTVINIENKQLTKDPTQMTSSTDRWSQPVVRSRCAATYVTNI